MPSSHPLFVAIQEGRTDAVIALLTAGTDPDVAPAPDGRTPLMHAAAHGEVESVAALVAAGADVNRLNTSGLTPLCDAARNGSDEAVAIIRMLIDSGAELDKGRPSTPLMCASADSIAAMQVLLDAGADPNATRPVRGTALHVCIDYNNLSGAKLLTAFGADPQLPVPSLSNPALDPTAYEYARRRHRDAIVNVFMGVSLTILSHQQLLGRLEELAINSAYELRPGATETAIREFANTVSIDPSHLLLDMYRRADGQVWSAEKPLATSLDDARGRGWYYLPLGDAVMHWYELTQALDDGAFARQRNLKRDPGVARAWWNRRWVPFLTDGAGAYVCLDFAPAVEGTIGQVIVFEHDSPIRRRLASDLREFFSLVDF